MSSNITTPTVIYYEWAQDSDAIYLPDPAGSDQTTDEVPSQQYGFPDLFSENVQTTSNAQLPSRAQINGIFQYITNMLRYINAGGQWTYDSTFASSSVTNGYPLGAILFDPTNLIWWLNLTDGNTNALPSAPTAGLENNGWIQFGLGQITNAPYGSVVFQSLAPTEFAIASYTGFFETPPPAAYYAYRMYSSGTAKFIITVNVTFPSEGAVGTMLINLYDILVEAGLPYYTNNMPTYNCISEETGYAYSASIGISAAPNTSEMVMISPFPTENNDLPLYQLVSSSNPYLGITIDGGVDGGNWLGIIQFELTNNL